MEFTHCNHSMLRCLLHLLHSYTALILPSILGHDLPSMRCCAQVFPTGGWMVKNPIVNVVAADGSIWKAKFCIGERHYKYGRAVFEARQLLTPSL